MSAYSIENLIPVVNPEAYVHPTAVLIGDVTIAAGCSDSVLLDFVVVG